MTFARLADGKIVPVIVNRSNGRETRMKSKSPIIAVTRHTFLELAHMTSNPKLRLVYARMMARYYRREMA